MLSVTIIARDEQKYLPQCLASVQGLTDDLVVVIDPRTTDATAQLAQSAGARVALHTFANFSDQKNYATTLAVHDWILSLDADEYLTPANISEIQRLDFTAAGYRLPRINLIFGRAMQHTNWSPSDHSTVRLFDRQQAKWVGAIHEHVQSTGQIVSLQQPFYHHNYDTVEQFISQLNVYTTFEAQERHFSWPMLFLYPIWKFIRHYVIFLGFLDGWHGLYLSYLQALYGLVIYVKAWSTH